MVLNALYTVYFLMTPKIPKNMNKAMCDTTGIILHNERKILFINLLDRLVEMTFAGAKFLCEKMLDKVRHSRHIVFVT